MLFSFFNKSEFEKNLIHLIGYRTRSIVLFKTALNHRSVKENPAENNLLNTQTNIFYKIYTGQVKIMI